MGESERTKGERTRIAHMIANIRGLLDGLEATIAMPAVPVSESAHAVADAAGRLVNHAGRLDAFQLAEVDARRASLDLFISTRQGATAAQPGPTAVVVTATGCDRRHSLGFCHDPNCYHRPSSRSTPAESSDCPAGGMHDPEAPTYAPARCRKCHRAL